MGKNMNAYKLITASPTTRRWLSIIKSELKKICPNIGYRETKHYAPLYSSVERKIIAHLNPQSGQIRIFLRIPCSTDELLQPTPSTGSYAKNFPSLFILKNEALIEKAIELIILSYNL
ncbi:MAG: hypothetical protein RBS20_04160 [Atribacterota bacterium]|jgi:hypothetical protein|nr:hypothetical protein [Atribacterota bacterium]